MKRFKIGFIALFAFGACACAHTPIENKQGRDSELEGNQR